MIDKIKVAYKDEEIDYLDWNESWQWGDYSNKSLKKVMEYIDNAFKRELSPTEAYYFSYRNLDEPEVVTVTSPAKDEKDKWWIKYDGRRQKVSAVYVIAPDNDAKLQEIRSQSAVVKTEQERLNQLYRELRRLSVSDMKTKTEVAA